MASVRRWVRATLPEQARRARVTVLGDAPPPGEQAQIDYGRLGMWLDPGTGKVFCLATGPSRDAVIRIHERAGHPTTEVYELPIEV